jgi:hypothetical protein
MLLEKLQPLQLPIGALNYFARARCSAWQAPRLSFGREWPSEFCSWPVATDIAAQANVGFLGKSGSRCQMQQSTQMDP